MMKHAVFLKIFHQFGIRFSGIPWDARIDMHQVHGLCDGSG